MTKMNGIIIYLILLIHIIYSSNAISSSISNKLESEAESEVESLTKLCGIYEGKLNLVVFNKNKKLISNSLNLNFDSENFNFYNKQKKTLIKNFKTEDLQKINKIPLIRPINLKENLKCFELIFKNNQNENNLKPNIKFIPLTLCAGSVDEKLNFLKQIVNKKQCQLNRIFKQKNGIDRQEVLENSNVINKLLEERKKKLLEIKKQMLEEKNSTSCCVQDPQDSQLTVDKDLQKLQEIKEKLRKEKDKYREKPFQFGNYTIGDDDVNNLDKNDKPNKPSYKNLLLMKILKIKEELNEELNKGITSKEDENKLLKRNQELLEEMKKLQDKPLKDLIKDYQNIIDKEKEKALKNNMDLLAFLRRIENMPKGNFKMCLPKNAQNENNKKNIPYTNQMKHTCISIHGIENFDKIKECMNNNNNFCNSCCEKYANISQKKILQCKKSCEKAIKNSALEALLDKPLTKPKGQSEDEDESENEKNKRKIDQENKNKELLDGLLTDFKKKQENEKQIQKQKGNTNTAEEEDLNVLDKLLDPKEKERLRKLKELKKKNRKNKDEEDGKKNSELDKLLELAKSKKQKRIKKNITNNAKGKGKDQKTGQLQDLDDIINDFNKKNDLDKLRQTILKEKKDKNKYKKYELLLTGNYTNNKTLKSGELNLIKTIQQEKENEDLIDDLINKYKNKTLEKEENQKKKNDLLRRIFEKKGKKGFKGLNGSNYDSPEELKDDDLLRNLLPNLFENDQNRTQPRNKTRKDDLEKNNNLIDDLMGSFKNKTIGKNKFDKEKNKDNNKTLTERELTLEELLTGSKNQSIADYLKNQEKDKEKDKDKEREKNKDSILENLLGIGEGISLEDGLKKKNYDLSKNKTRKTKEPTLEELLYSKPEKTDDENQEMEKKQKRKKNKKSKKDLQSTLASLLPEFSDIENDKDKIKDDLLTENNKVNQTLKNNIEDKINKLSSKDYLENIRKLINKTLIDEINNSLKKKLDPKDKINLTDFDLLNKNLTKELSAKDLLGKLDNKLKDKLNKLYSLSENINKNKTDIDEKSDDDAMKTDLENAFKTNTSDPFYKNKENENENVIDFSKLKNFGNCSDSKIIQKVNGPQHDSEDLIGNELVYKRKIDKINKKSENEITKNKNKDLVKKYAKNKNRKNKIGKNNRKNKVGKKNNKNNIMRKLEKLFKLNPNKGSILLKKKLLEKFSKKNVKGECKDIISNGEKQKNKNNNFVIEHYVNGKKIYIDLAKLKKHKNSETFKKLILKPIISIINNKKNINKDKTLLNFSSGLSNKNNSSLSLQNKLIKFIAQNLNNKKNDKSQSEILEKFKRFIKHNIKDSKVYKDGKFIYSNKKDMKSNNNLRIVNKERKALGINNYIKRKEINSNPTSNNKFVNIKISTNEKEKLINTSDKNSNNKNKRINNLIKKSKNKKSEKNFGKDKRNTKMKLAEKVLKNLGIFVPDNLTNKSDTTNSNSIDLEKNCNISDILNSLEDPNNGPDENKFDYINKQDNSTSLEKCDSDMNLESNKLPPLNPKTCKDKIVKKSSRNRIINLNKNSTKEFLNKTLKKIEEINLNDINFNNITNLMRILKKTKKDELKLLSKFNMLIQIKNFLEESCNKKAFEISNIFYKGIIYKLKFLKEKKQRLSDFTLVEYDFDNFNNNLKNKKCSNDTVVNNIIRNETKNNLEIIAKLIFDSPIECLNFDHVKELNLNNLNGKCDKIKQAKKLFDKLLLNKTRFSVLVKLLTKLKTTKNILFKNLKKIKIRNNKSFNKTNIKKNSTKINKSRLNNTNSNRNTTETKKNKGKKLTLRMRINKEIRKLLSILKNKKIKDYTFSANMKNITNTKTRKQTKKTNNTKTENLIRKKLNKNNNKILRKIQRKKVNKLLANETCDDFVISFRIKKFCFDKNGFFKFNKNNKSICKKLQKFLERFKIKKLNKNEMKHLVIPSDYMILKALNLKKNCNKKPLLELNSKINNLKLNCLKIKSSLNREKDNLNNEDQQVEQCFNKLTKLNKKLQNKISKCKKYKKILNKFKNLKSNDTIHEEKLNDFNYQNQNKTKNKSKDIIFQIPDSNCTIERITKAVSGPSYDWEDYIVNKIFSSKKNKNKVLNKNKKQIRRIIPECKDKIIKSNKKNSKLNKFSIKKNNQTKSKLKTNKNCTEDENSSLEGRVSGPDYFHKDILMSNDLFNKISKFEEECKKNKSSNRIKNLIFKKNNKNKTEESNFPFINGPKETAEDIIIDSKDKKENKISKMKRNKKCYKLKEILENEIEKRTRFSFVPFKCNDIVNKNIKKEKFIRRNLNKNKKMNLIKLEKEKQLDEIIEREVSEDVKNI